MPKNRLTINHFDDLIQLSWQRGKEVPRSSLPIPFKHPFDEKALDELRWYLEEYLRFPYGIEPDKAAKVEQKLQDWGQQLFELVFRNSEKTRQFFQAATYEGLDNCELSISSERPEVLNLPWELLYSPDDKNFLAPSLAQMYRSLNSQSVRAEMEEIKEGKLNILLVISRPYGEQDINFKTIARPMLLALQPIQQQVNLKVLRPPSFEAFEREINNNKGFYHIVHFDGHGDFDFNSTGLQYQFGDLAGQGLLVFEAEDGSPQKVNAAQIAQNLIDCNVPIFVLNACKSAQEGKESFSSVATRLVALGAKGVVAMGYSVYAEGAKHFIGRLYEQLVQGNSLANAVAAGRREMINKKLCPSPKGDLPLQDWLIPVLYQQESYTPFRKASNIQEKDFTDLDQFLDEPQPSKLIDLPEEEAYGFIGRDYDILRLERAFRKNNFVLLQGMGGIGKTQLACGFARWLEETQGRGGQMFYTSFEHGAGLSQVINQVGRTVWGDKFSQYLFEKQTAAVQKYLKDKPCLLIWDNFESVTGFQSIDKPLLSAKERNELKQFLNNLRKAKSWVLIASRQEELWLDCSYTLVKLGGLNQQDTEELANRILRTAGIDKKNLPKEYLELLHLLGNHPLCLRVILPCLKKQTPLQLIEALRLGLDAFSDFPHQKKDKSLTISLNYSFSKLSKRTQKHLPFLAFFSKIVNAQILDFFVSKEVEICQPAYQAVFGEILNIDDWFKILNEAVNAGILERYNEVGTTVYKIHPALPWYLQQRLFELYSEEKINQLQTKLLYFYAALAQKYDKELINQSQTASTLLLIEEPNLLLNLRLAEQQQAWDETYAIVRALSNVYLRIGDNSKRNSLRQRILGQIGMNSKEVKKKGKDAFYTWLCLREIDGAEGLDLFDLETAKQIYEELLDELIKAKKNPELKNLPLTHLTGSAYYGLGGLAQKLRQFDEASKYYDQAIQIDKQTKNFHSAASTYRQLGLLAIEQQQLKKASGYLQTARQIFEDEDDLYEIANLYLNLGNLARLKLDLDEARKYCEDTIQICEDEGYLRIAASAYHNLGIIAEAEDKDEEAVLYLRRALQIAEDCKGSYHAAPTYYHLGLLSQKQRHFDDAISYSQKARQIYIKAKDLYKSSSPCESLGIVAREQKRFNDAITYFKEAYAIKKDYEDYLGASITLTEWGETLAIQKNWNEAISTYIKAIGWICRYFRLNKDDVNPNICYLHSSNINALGRILKVLGEKEFERVVCEVTSTQHLKILRKDVWKAAGLSINKKNRFFLNKIFRIFS
ncbi:MAG: tetratricopeptide repeat protein [Pleurocapsa minor HA4230-MV1]|jgi:tetratricopeptide (TPR) repeat protein|nr:tetratricopeptide repeat protein [Pleurocapsa minor HA4230-MV1]